MKLLDADRIVSVYLFDAEYEDFSIKQMTIEEMLDSFTEEGCSMFVSDQDLDKQ